MANEYGVSPFSHNAIFLFSPALHYLFLEKEMERYVSIDEVFTDYHDEWVLLDEIETKDNLTVQGGRVVGHDPDRSVVEMMAIEMRLPKCVIICRKQKDGKDAISRDYAVSTITSFEEIESVVNSKGT